jgi:hypothetical protein
MAKAKGSSLVSAIKWLNQSRDAALKSLPPPLHHYLDEPIQVANWYPEEDLVELIRALARIMPANQSKIYEQMGRVSAREQFAGVYRHLLEGGDEFSLPRRGLVLWQSQHDSGRLSMKMAGSSTATIEIVGYAIPNREMCQILLGYTAEMFVMAEFKAPVVFKTGCRLEGADRCSWQISWTPSPAAAASRR